jgi:hypothetical protein
MRKTMRNQAALTLQTNYRGYRGGYNMMMWIMRASENGTS